MIRLFLSHYNYKDIVELYNLLTVAAGLASPGSSAQADIDEALTYIAGYADSWADSKKSKGALKK